MLKARVYLNGKDLGEFVSSYIPICFNITEQAKQNDNELIVALDSHEDPNYPPFWLRARLFNILRHLS